VTATLSGTFDSDTLTKLCDFTVAAQEAVLFLSRGWQAPEFEAIRSLAFAALPGTVQCQICYFASREPLGSGLLIFMFAGS
jgi:hypothetical protein